MKVSKLNASKINADGSLITLIFGKDADRVTLEFPYETLQTIAQEMSAVLSEAAKSRDPNAPIPAPTPTGFGIAPTADNKAVLLTFQMKNGLNHNFAFQASDADLLQSRIAETLERQKRGS
jgi:hypothetical protein